MCVNNNGMELWGNKYVGTRSQSVSRLYIPPTTPRSIHPLRDWSCVCGDQRERERYDHHMIMMRRRNWDYYVSNSLVQCG